MRLKTFFYGGIELNGNRERTMRVPVANAALPNVAIIPMLQHQGEPASPLVHIGDTVKENMCIGRSPDSGISIHSPIPGVVREFRQITRPDGIRCTAVVVELTGAFDRTGRIAKDHDWEQLNPDELLDLIQDMGVSGLGNSSVPTHIKLGAHRLSGSKARASHLIINVMESEPYLTGDYRCLLEKTSQVLEGIRIIQHILGMPPTIMALNADYKAAAPLVKKTMAQIPVALSVQVLAAIYPQGDDRLLSQTLLHVDQARTGPDGCGELVVINVSTVLAVWEAVVLRKPLMERVVTIAGDAVRQALNLRVRIGTPIAWLLEECGGLKYLPDRIVIGGPLTGKTIIDPETPVTKETRAILALGRQEINYAPTRDCLRCGNCVRLCPSGLEPINLIKLIRRDMLDQAYREDLALCTECGLCSFACPSHIPLVQLLRDGKSKMVIQQ